MKSTRTARKPLSLSCCVRGSVLPASNASGTVFPVGRGGRVLAPICAAAEQGVLTGILLLQEAWQPPLKETELFLRELRRVTGERIPLTILLVGKPAAETVLTPVDPEPMRIWVQKLDALGDPCLEVLPLVQP